MIFRYSEKKAKIFALANSLFEKAKANQSEWTENFRGRSEANSLRFASLFALANFALRIYMPELDGASLEYWILLAPLSQLVINSVQADIKEATFFTGIIALLFTVPLTCYWYSSAFVELSKPEGRLWIRIDGNYFAGLIFDWQLRSLIISHKQSRTSHLSRKCLEREVSRATAWPRKVRQSRRETWFREECQSHIKKWFQLFSASSLLSKERSYSSRKTSKNRFLISRNAND